MSKLYLDNLYRRKREPGDLVCLLIPDASALGITDKHPALPSVVFATEGTGIQTTYKTDFDARFEKVEEVAVADLSEAQLKMIRRANPGDMDLDFIKVFEGWSESEANMTGHMIELAVGHVMSLFWHLKEEIDPSDNELELTIKTEDLQSFLQNYEVTRTPLPHGFKFKITKSFPESA